MIPGFLQVQLANSIRAGGALAVFIVVFFYNPAALISKPAENIAPLQQPTDVTPSLSPRRSYRSQSTVTPLTIGASLLSPADAAELKRPADPSGTSSQLAVVRVLQGKAQPQASRSYDVTLSNASHRELLLSTLSGRWRFSPGILASIEQGVALTPIAQYALDFPVDVESSEWHSKSEAMSPAIALPPGSSDNPSLVVFRLQIGYHLSGRLSYHPYGGWSIKYDAFVTTLDGQRLQVVENGGWADKH